MSKYFLSFENKRITTLAIFLILASSAAVQAQGFGNRTDYFFSLEPVGVALGDLNNDGHLDVATIDFRGGVTVRLGQASGGIGTGAIGFNQFGPVVNPGDLVIGDANNDGLLDIITANLSTNFSLTTPCSVSVLLHNPSGFGYTATSYATAPGSRGIALGDVNGDGRPDVVIGSETTNSVTVMPSMASGGFGAITTYTAGSKPSELILRDINGDGRLDIVTANRNGGGAGSASVLLGIAGGGFAAKADYVTGNGPSSLALGDVNGDGLLDLVTANAGPGASTVSVLLGIGSGVFGPKMDYPTGGFFPTGVALGDVNGDGRLDIATSNPGGSGGNTASIFLGLVGGGFSTSTNYTTDREPVGVALGDLDGDNRLDLVTVNRSGPSVSVRLGLGTPTAVTSQSLFTQVQVYPNPTDGVFTLTLPKESSSQSVVLFNLLGQATREQILSSGQTRFDATGIAPGVYSLQIHLDGQTITRRVVIK